MTQSLPKAVIFDMDGTLIDSERLAAECLHAALSEAAIELDLDRALQLIVGKTWESAFGELLAAYPEIDPNLGKTVIERYQSRLRSGGLVEIPGAKDFIREVSEVHCLPLALVSGSDRKDVEFVLESFGVRDLFSTVLGAEDYPRSKPSPDGFNQAIAELGHDATEIWVFEDSIPGIQAGRAAGLTVIALEHANHFGQDQSDAHHLIEHFEATSFAELKKALLGH